MQGFRATSALLAALLIAQPALAQDFDADGVGHVRINGTNGLTEPGRLGAVAGLDIRAPGIGAKFDAQNVTALASIAAGSNALSVAGGLFTSSDIGKNIWIDGAGPLSTLGILASVPVTVAGSGYTAAPTVNFGGLGSAVGVKAVANLKIIAATVLTAGVGCTNGPQTFPLIGTVRGTAATFTATVFGGALPLGPITVTTGGSYQPGSFNDPFFAAAAIGGFVPGCSTFPTIAATWGVESITIVGRGEGVPLAGVTASLSTGSATVGAPVVSRFATPLSTTIGAVNSNTSILLATNANTSVVAAPTTITWGHDDGPAFALAKAEADAIFAATGAAPVIQLPYGSSLISTPVPTFWKTPLRLQGGGPGQTNIYMDPAMTAPLFSTSENWIGTNFVANPNVWPFNNGWAPSMVDFSIYGDITTQNDQVAFNFYDRTDKVNMVNVAGATIHGSLFRTGDLLNADKSYIRESNFNNVYCAECGSQDNPVYDIVTTSIIGADSSNNLEFHNLMAWGTDGSCISIRSKTPAGGKFNHGINFYGGRCESGRSYSAADLVKIGDSAAAYTGGADSVNFYGTRCQGVSLGASCLKIDAPVGGDIPRGISWKGMYANGAGFAVNIQAGTQIDIEPDLLDNQNYKLIVGPAGNVAAPIWFNFHGAEVGMDAIIDPTSAAFIYWPMFRTGTPDLATASVSANPHDGSGKGGNALPNQAVDLQVARNDATQIPGATGAAIVGGVRNKISNSGISAVISGGADNSLNGRYSRAAGSFCDDLNRRGFDCYGGAAVFAATGTSQAFQTILGAAIASVTPTVLTVDGGAASSTNVLNVTTNDLLSFNVLVQCHDANGDYASWPAAAGVLTRVAGNASYAGAYSGATAPTRSTGAGATASITISADTTNQGLSILATMPNTHAWHCSAFLNGGETR